MRSWVRASVAGIFVACGTLGCARDEAGVSMRGPDPETLALDPRNPQEARVFIFGDAVLFTAPGLGLALAVDGGAAPERQDGYVEQVFLLQQEEPSGVPQRLLRDAEMFYAGRMLMVRAKGEAPLTFMIRGDPEPVVDALPFSVVGSERFAGYGLSRRTGAWTLALNEVTAASMADLLPAPPPDQRQP